MTVNLDDIDFGSSVCVCPKCGKEIPHAKRGVPCSKLKCPACGSTMRGQKCAQTEE